MAGGAICLADSYPGPYDPSVAANNTSSIYTLLSSESASISLIPSASVTSIAPSSTSVFVTVPTPLSTVTPRVAITTRINNTQAVSSINNQETDTTSPDIYTFYSGDGRLGWPTISQWISFEDLWNRNLPLIANNCDQTEDETQQVGGAIQAIAEASLLDHRHILVTIIQESKGCVRVITTSSSHRNPGLMQSYNGTGSCNNEGQIQTPCPSEVILQMVQDGSMGVINEDLGINIGPGLVQYMNDVAMVNGSGAQAYYQASRIYNAGSIPDYDNLGSSGATECYVSDIANRLTGWAMGAHGCVPSTVDGTAVAARSILKPAIEA